MKKSLTATNPANEREVNRMVGKAMCAYANWLGFVKATTDQIDKMGRIKFHELRSANKSEYEATCRCIEMFVYESIYTIQDFIKERVAEEFGIR